MFDPKVIYDQFAGEFLVVALEQDEAREVARREPRVRAAAALWSPDTGIVDSHQLCSSYQAEVERHGAQLALATRVVSLERTGSGWRLETLGPDLGRFQLEAASVVNAAGISAGGIARAAGLDLEAIGDHVGETAVSVITDPLLLDPSLVFIY